MLEHLDDHDGFTPDDGFRTAVVRRGRQLRRRRRLSMAGAGLAVVVLAGVGGAAGLAAWRWDQVDRVTIRVAEQGGTEAPVATDVVVPGVEAPLGPLDILVVGSDERTGAEADQVAGARADVIALVQLDPERLDAHVTSVPRDLWVPIAGTGRSGRVNTALDVGPATLVATVEDLLEVHVDHYVALDFDGFRELVDAAGGVDVWIPRPLRDRASGLSVTTTGCVRLDGEAALAFVRGRHTEELQDGRWVADGRGDLGRIERQQAFGQALVAALGDLGSGPRDLDRLTRVLADHATLDDDLDLATLRALLGLVRALEPGDITTTVVPATPATVGAAAVLLPLTPAEEEARRQAAAATDPGFGGGDPGVWAPC